MSELAGKCRLLNVHPCMIACVLRIIHGEACFACVPGSAHAGVWAYQRGWPALIEQQRLQQHIVACLRCIVQHAVAQTAGQHRVQNQLRGDLVAVRELCVACYALYDGTALVVLVR